MKNTILLILIITLTSCATKPSHKKDTSEAVDELISAGKFEDAEAISPNNLKIKNSKACFPIFSQCEEKQSSINNVRRCQYNIDQLCFGHNNSSYNYPKSTGNRLDQLKIKLIEELERLSKENEEIEVKLCESGFRWSYKKVKNCGHCAWSLSINPKDLIGKFTSRDKCEEARILEDKVFDTGHSCVQHYIGNDKFLDSYELIAMSDFKKFDLEFPTLKECELVVKNGIDYYDNDLQKHEIGPFGSSGNNRVIGQCKTKKRLICSEKNQI